MYLLSPSLCAIALWSITLPRRSLDRILPRYVTRSIADQRLAVLYISHAQNHRTMVALQICGWSDHAAVEAIQDEGTGGVGAIKATGAGTTGSCGGRDSDREVIGGMERPSEEERSRSGV
jgi:hypothetical protein